MAGSAPRSTYFATWKRTGEALDDGSRDLSIGSLGDEVEVAVKCSRLVSTASLGANLAVPDGDSLSQLGLGAVVTGADSPLTELDGCRPDVHSS